MTPLAIEAVRFTRSSEHHLPLAGGLLDQTQSFVDAMEWTRAERNRWEAEAGK